MKFYQIVLIIGWNFKYLFLAWLKTLKMKSATF